MALLCLLSAFGCIILLSVIGFLSTIWPLISFILVLMIWVYLSKALSQEKKVLAKGLALIFLVFFFFNIYALVIAPRFPMARSALKHGNIAWDLKIFKFLYPSWLGLDVIQEDTRKWLEDKAVEEFKAKIEEIKKRPGITTEQAMTEIEKIQKEIDKLKKKMTKQEESVAKKEATATRKIAETKKTEKPPPINRVEKKSPSPPPPLSAVASAQKSNKPPSLSKKFVFLKQHFPNYEIKSTGVKLNHGEEIAARIDPWAPQGQTKWFIKDKDNNWYDKNWPISSRAYLFKNIEMENNSPILIYVGVQTEASSNTEYTIFWDEKRKTDTLPTQVAASSRGEVQPYRSQRDFPDAFSVKPLSGRPADDYQSGPISRSAK